MHAGIREKKVCDAVQEGRGSLGASDDKLIIDGSALCAQQAVYVGGKQLTRDALDTISSSDRENPFSPLRLRT